MFCAALERLRNSAWTWLRARRRLNGFRENFGQRAILCFYRGAGAGIFERQPQMIREPPCKPRPFVRLTAPLMHRAQNFLQRDQRSARVLEDLQVFLPDGA